MAKFKHSIVQKSALELILKMSTCAHSNASDSTVHSPK